MAQRRYYRVGEHVFSVTAEESVLALMSNYSSFLVDGPAGKKTVFDLTIRPPFNYQLSTINSPLTHLYTDTSDDDMPRIEIYRSDEDWLFQVSETKASEICIRLFASADMQKAQLQFVGPATRFGIDNASMLLYAFSTATLHTLLMHASVIERQGYAYLFLGHSGTGKSTHSRMWMQAFDDARLLNDDNPVLRLMDDGQVRVYGSPWSGKTPCYINRDVPVRAIIQLKQAPENRMMTLSLPQAYAYMLSSASGMKIDSNMMDSLYDTISTVIQTVPVSQLLCLPDTDAAHVCYNHFISDRQKKVLRFLEEHDIPFSVYNHPEGKTIEEAKRWWRDDGSLHCKNIFMRNHKGNQHYLICFPCDDDLAIHDIEHWLKEVLVAQGLNAPGKLSFASPERMMRYLGLEPGSVSPFGLINDTEHHVILFLDSRLREAESLSFHPNDCRGTVVISQEAFQQYLSIVGNRVEYIRCK